jgi:hypothetical protein
MEQSYYQRNKAKILEKRKQYYQKNKQQIIKNNMKYQKENKDKAKKYNKKYISKPDIKQKLNILSKQYYKDNKDAVIQRQNEYRQTENYRIALKKYNKKRRLKRRQLNHDTYKNFDKTDKHKDNITADGKYILRFN